MSDDDRSRKGNRGPGMCRARPESILRPRRPAAGTRDHPSLLRFPARSVFPIPGCVGPGRFAAPELSTIAAVCQSHLGSGSGSPRRVTGSETRGSEVVHGVMGVQRPASKSSSVPRPAASSRPASVQAKHDEPGVPLGRINQEVGEVQVEGKEDPALALAGRQHLGIGTALEALVIHGHHVVTQAAE